MNSTNGKAVDAFFEFLREASQGELVEIEQNTVKLALEALGANFEGLTDEDLANLGQYTNFRKGKAMKKILPKVKREQFKDWNQSWADQHEMPKLVPLAESDTPKEEKSNSEGTKGFFYTLFSYATGVYTFGMMKAQYTARGYNHGVNSKAERLHVMHPKYDVADMVYTDGTKRTKEVPFAPASMDKKFCSDLADFLAQWI